MSRLKVLLPAAALLAAAVGGIALCGGDAVACWRRCAPVCCPAPCVQYVYVERYVERDSHHGDKSYAVQTLFILDTDTPGTQDLIRGAANDLRSVLDNLPKEFRGEVTEIKSTDLRKDVVLQKVQQMEVGPNETLFVYCNVHGAKVVKKPESSASALTGTMTNPDEPIPIAYDDQELQMSPSLPKDTPADQKKLLRSELMDAIKAKNCRLKVLITDSCFAPPRKKGPARFPSEVPDEPNPEVLRPRIHHQRSGDARNVITDLLVNHKGVLNINSSKPDEEALGNVFVPALTELCEGSYSPAKWRNPDDPKASFLATLSADVTSDFSESVKSKFSGSSEQEQRLQKQGVQTVCNLERDENGRGVYPEYSPAAEREAEAVEETAATQKYGQAPGAAAPSEEDSGDQPYVVPTPSDDNGSPEEESSQTPAPATIVVNVPAGTRLFIDNEPTRQKAGRRVFQTPELPSGREFTYGLRAEMPAAAGVVTQVQEVTVRAGRQTEITFDPAKDPVATRPRPAGSPANHENDVTRR